MLLFMIGAMFGAIAGVFILAMVSAASDRDDKHEH